MPIVLKSGSLNILELSGPDQACNGIAFVMKNGQLTEQTSLFVKTSPLFPVRQTRKTVSYCAWLQRKQRNRKIYSMSNNGGRIYHHDFTACKQSVFPVNAVMVYEGVGA